MEQLGEFTRLAAQDLARQEVVLRLVRSVRADQATLLEVAQMLVEIHGHGRVAVAAAEAGRKYTQQRVWVSHQLADRSVRKVGLRTVRRHKRARRCADERVDLDQQ